jgi:hypothetical protein
MREPWNAIHQVAEYTSAAYSPGDDAGPGRCDLQLIQDACYAGRLAMEGARGTPEDADACEAVGELLHTLHRVLTGMSGDLRDLAEGAGEFAEDLARMRGPTAV